MGRKSEGRKTEEKRVVERLPHYGRFDYARLGYFSLTTKDTKFISREDSLTIDGVTETPGYFFGQFMKGLWVGKQKNPNKIDLSYPYKAIPGKIPYAAYIDIRSAYRQIAAAFGMEVFIEEGRICAYGETTPLAPCFDNKICRGLLVTGLGKKGNYQEWKDRDLRTVEFSNPNYAPHVTYCIWATLHAIQAHIDPFSAYCHTDGFIVARRHIETVTGILDKFGFAYAIKASGFTEIFGVGSYRVGDTRTRVKLHPDRTRRYIREDNSKWWLEHYAEGIQVRNELQASQFY